MTNTKGEQTQKALELAIHRITTGRVRKVKPERKLSIAAVAEEAGVSTAPSIIGIQRSPIRFASYSTKMPGNKGTRKARH